MKPLELAHQYLEIFYHGKDPQELLPLLADDLHFKGPFFEFHSAKDYIASLVALKPC